MLAAISEAVVIGIVFALAALPVVLITLVLATQRPPSVSRGFLGGWLLGLATAAALVISLVDLAEQGDSSPHWVGWLKIVLGALLIALAVRKWLARPRDGSAPETPKWMSTVHSLDARKAFGLAFLLAAANPKNLVVVASAATVIAEATSRPFEQIAALLVFVVVASSGVAAPSVLRRALGERSEPVLSAADAWMTRHSALIMSSVLVVLGAALVSNGIAGV